ncbi:hypothetical protein [Microcoleus sp. S13_C3]|uniref:hypothetical protein n=1 Tax=Microcoleus sp. S13_C3 TaxID=3055409 RepID=UPI002FD55117
MTLKMNLLCSSCQCRTLHEEMSYTDLAKLDNETGVLENSIAVLLDRYPWAKRFIGLKETDSRKNIVPMQCTVCGSPRGLGDGI